MALLPIIINNNNKQICIAPLGHNFSGAGARQRISEQIEEIEKAWEKRNVFSLDFKQVTQLSLTNPRDALHHGKQQNFTAVT